MDVEDYILAAPSEAQAILRRIRSMVREQFPDAEEVMSYKMPAFREGRVFIYYAAFKSHIGIYPPVTAPDSLVQALEPYAGAKGNLQFPYGQHMPFDLIEKVITALHQTYAVRK
jgi:uncharacterized protein YdhG (YjbR/CyaY superfamily)